MSVRFCSWHLEATKFAHHEVTLSDMHLDCVVRLSKYVLPHITSLPNEKHLNIFFFEESLRVRKEVSGHD